MLVNDGEMSVWSYTHFTIIDEHFTIINELAWSKQSFAHLTILEKLHQLYKEMIIYSQSLKKRSHKLIVRAGIDRLCI